MEELMVDHDWWITIWFISQCMDLDNYVKVDRKDRSTIHLYLLDLFFFIMLHILGLMRNIIYHGGVCCLCLKRIQNGEWS